MLLVSIGAGDRTDPNRSMSIAVEIRAPVQADLLHGILSTRPDVSVEFDTVVPTGRTGQQLWISAPGGVDDLSAMIAEEPTEAIEVVDALSDRLLVRIDRSSVEAPLLEVAGSVEGQVMKAVGTADGWTLDLRFRGASALSSFFGAAERRDIEVELRVPSPEGGPRRAGRYGLTPSQRETLVLAFESGYFEIPRQATLAELAEVLDISEQGVSERLRRATDTVLRVTFQTSTAETVEE